MQAEGQSGSRVLRPWRGPFSGDPGEFARDLARRIEFHSDIALAASDAWDASEAGDGSVLAWMKGGGLHFAAQGGVIAPENCGRLFALFRECREIRFNGCFDTSRATNMRGMFEHCAALRTLDLRNFDTGRVTDMSDLFWGCEALSSLDVRGFDTGRVTNMSRMFERCESLTELDLRNFDTGRVTNMAGMFWGCKSLRALDLRSFDVAQVEDMSQMFEHCKLLRTLELTGFRTGRAEMKYMFADCPSLRALDLSGFRIDWEADACGMFWGCESLRPAQIRGFFDLPEQVRMTLPGQS